MKEIQTKSDAMQCQCDRRTLELTNLAGLAVKGSNKGKEEGKMPFLTIARVLCVALIALTEFVFL